MLMTGLENNLKDLSQQLTHTLHVGNLHSEGEILDEVVISLFIKSDSDKKKQKKQKNKS